MDRIKAKLNEAMQISDAAAAAWAVFYGPTLIELAEVAVCPTCGLRELRCLLPEHGFKCFETGYGHRACKHSFHVVHNALTKEKI